MKGLGLMFWVQQPKQRPAALGRSQDFLPLIFVLVFQIVLTEAKKIFKKTNCRLLENYFCTFIKHLSFQMVTTLGECMQHALKQGKSEGKSHSISLLTSIIELPRTVFQEYTINTVNTKLLHQILSSVCLKARHDVNFCSFCN